MATVEAVSVKNLQSPWPIDSLTIVSHQDTPEQADLTANLAACNQHIDFIKSIPSRLAEMSSQHAEHRIPSIDDLETTPIFPLIAAHPAYKTRSATAAQASTSSSRPVTDIKAKTKSSKKSKIAAEKKKQDDSIEGKKEKFVKLPPSIAALPENQRPTPDPERWLPKRERKGYAEVLAAKEREKEKKRLKARKKLEATLTQGSASSGPAQDEGNSRQPQSGGSGGGKAKNNKKKGKR